MTSKSEASSLDILSSLNIICVPPHYHSFIPSISLLPRVCKLCDSSINLLASSDNKSVKCLSCNDFYHRRCTTEGLLGKRVLEEQARIDASGSNETNKYKCHVVVGLLREQEKKSKRKSFEWSSDGPPAAHWGTVEEQKKLLELSKAPSTKASPTKVPTNVLPNVLPNVPPDIPTKVPPQAEKPAENPQKKMTSTKAKPKASSFRNIASVLDEAVTGLFRKSPPPHKSYRQLTAIMMATRKKQCRWHRER